jgi:tetratricopeptide (TPR) repeat protein
MKKPYITRFSCSVAAAFLLFFVVQVFSHPGDEHKLEHLNSKITQQPNSQTAHIKRAALYTRTGNYILAEKDFITAKTLGEVYLASYELGVYYFKTENHALAINQFDNYLKYFPNHYPALEYRAKTYIKMGDTKKAFEDFDAFLENSPYTNPGHYIAVAKIALSDTDRKDPIGDAITIIDSGISQTGNSPQLQSFAIELEISRNFFNQAITRHESLREITSASPRWHLEMAEILVKSERWAKAHDYLNHSEMKLAQYKKTPAREKLSLRIEKMQQHVSKNYDVDKGSLNH